MLDIRFIADNPDIIKENIKKKFQNDLLPLVDSLIKDYKDSLKLKKDIEELRHRRNSLSQEINKLLKENKPIEKQKKEARQIPEKIKFLEERQGNITNSIEKNLVKIPNILHKSVPIGKDESKNKTIRKWGAIPKFNFNVKNHVELAESLNLADFEVSAKLAGNGFYLIKNELGLLNQALIQFAISHMFKKRYNYVETPLMIKHDIIGAAMDIEEFKNSIYEVKDEDLKLIGTSEHSILGIHKDETIKEDDLPKKYFCYSMCFRKEIGSHGINEKGFWRTHQFNKVEQFIFSPPKDSYKYYDELLKNTEELFRKLKLPYRVNEMCSGQLASWKSKSADIEVYRPTTKTYEEVASLSNCTDYQARKLKIKMLKKDGTKEIVHTLNNTVVATSRALVAILENYQQKDGSIKVPAVLQKHMHGIKVIKRK